VVSLNSGVLVHDRLIGSLEDTQLLSCLRSVCSNRTVCEYEWLMLYMVQVLVSVARFMQLSCDSRLRYLC